MILTRRQILAAMKTAEAVVEQLRAMLPPEPPPPNDTQRCPRCSSTDLAEAGQDQVCADCGANVRDGQVIGG